MTMRFDWTQRPLTEWRDYYAKAPRCNYLQSLPFARAVQVCDQKRARFALIFRDNKSDQDEQAIGMAVVQEIKLGPIHVVHLYRGPLWFVASPPKEWMDEFAALFAATFPRRPFRMRRWLPECSSDPDLTSALEKRGFRAKGQSYETSWIDLERPLHQIRAGLKQKWRNALNKGERADLDIQVDWSASTAKLFLSRYEQDRKEKKYRGRSVKFLSAEIEVARAFKEALILWAVCRGKPVAAIMVLTHGHSATYRIGWTTDAGRQLNAHNVLLWHAIKHLKEAEIHQFDVGGVEPTTASGLTQFKAGLGGEAFRTPGLYR